MRANFIVLLVVGVSFFFLGMYAVIDLEKQATNEKELCESHGGTYWRGNPGECNFFLTNQSKKNKI